jgi:preprotein translocase subunit SecB
MSDPVTPRQIVLQKVYVKDASLESPQAPQVFARAWQPQLDVQVTSSLATLNPEQHQVLLSVTVTAKLDQDVAFLAEVHQAGLFLIKGVGDESERRRLLGTECLTILYPFVREAVADLVQRGGFPSLLLQPIDFAALYQEHLLKSETAPH